MIKAGLIIIGLVFLFIGCKPQMCTTPPSPVLIRLVDFTNKDLLNPSLPNSFDFNNIKLYYIEDNRVKNMTVELNHFPGTDSFFLSTNLGWYSHLGRTFYLQLSPVDTDTLFVRVDEIRNDCLYFETKEFRYNSNSVIPKGIVTGLPYVYQVIK